MTETSEEAKREEEIIQVERLHVHNSSIRVTRCESFEEGVGPGVLSRKLPPIVITLNIIDKSFNQRPLVHREALFPSRDTNTNGHRDLLKELA